MKQADTPQPLNTEEIRERLISNLMSEEPEFVAQVCVDILGLLDEVERLKRGEFAPGELQNLCHNLSEEDAAAFCDGCDEYQRKLFGKCRTDEKDAEIERLREENEELRDKVLSDEMRACKGR